MATTLESAIGLGTCVPAVEIRKAPYPEIYKENCDRIYSLAFWMTDNELAAEELSKNTFLRAFAMTDQPAADQIDRALLTEIRETTSVGVLTLNPNTVGLTPSIRRNIKRVHLERAVVQIPATERLIFLLHDVEGYNHDRICRLLGISQEESRSGLHLARIQIRALIVGMN